VSNYGGFGDFTNRITVALPSDPNPSMTWAGAVKSATKTHRHLAVIIGLLPVTNYVITSLLEVVWADPMIGTAQPRFANAQNDTVLPLPAALGEPTTPTSRAVMALLPDTLITAEMQAACLVIRRDVVAAIELATGFGSVLGALAHCQCQARRRGFRNIVANRVIVPSTLLQNEVYPTLQAEDAALLSITYPDNRRATEENGEQPQRELERLLTAAYPVQNALRRLLLDCRGMAPKHNGTSQCVLGMLDGFARSDRPWQVTVLSSDAAASFHNLSSRYPAFEHVTKLGNDTFAAALLLNQPWGMHHVFDLHHHALQIGFNILDTIGWDIIYAAPAKVGEVWRFIGGHADVITFISQFSQERFRRRFPVSPAVSEAVVYLSLSEEEQTLRPLRDVPKGSHVMLFGNDYDHKGLGPTLELLVSTFPYQSFVVLGGEGSGSPTVREIPSGTLSEYEVHKLIATSRAIIYPSFYEGFGLPVVEGLAYGCPVLVRRSSLWPEIAARSRLEGKLIEFDDGASLIDTLSRVLFGPMPASLPFGVALNRDQAPQSWRDAAESVFDVFDARLSSRSINVWRERDELLRMMQP
jgi:glycosyltransferase involved in cell wall biosynthesis